VDDTGVRIVEAKLKELCPTQMTVGYDEVAFKRRNWGALTSEEKRCFIYEHPFPAVLGPRRVYYILDGHHLGRALLEDGVDEVFVSPIENLSHLDHAEFWRVTAQRHLIYPFALGRRRSFADMPRSLRELHDDPFRSLTARIHRACQYEKDSLPFAEFKSADFLRGYISMAALKAYPERVFQYARTLLRNRVDRYDKQEGSGSIPPARIARPRCHHSRRRCEECHAGVMADQMA